MKAGRKISRKGLLAYGVAVLSVAIALGLTWLLAPWLYPTVTPLFFIAVMVSAWLGGWGPGLLATVLSTLAISHFFIAPLYSLQVGNVGSAVRLSVFAIAAGLINWLNQRQSQALADAKQNYQALRETVGREAATRAENRQAEELLRQSEGRFRLMADTVPQSIWITDADGRVQYFNKHWTDYCGISAEPTMMAEVATQFLHPDDTPVVVAAFEEARQTGSPFEVEQRHRSASGEYRWFLNRAVPYRDPHTREIMQWFGVGVDIDDRKRRELNNAFLDRVGKDLMALSEPDEIMQTIGAGVGEFLHLSGCIFVDVDEDTREVTVHHGWTTETVPSLKQTFRLDDFLTEEFIRAGHAGETFIVRDATQDDRTDTQNYAELKIGAFVTVPFHLHGRWQAYIAATSVEPRNWRTDEIELLQEISNRLFPRIERARAEVTLAADLKDMQLLQKLSARLLIEDDPQTLYQEILATAIALTRADAGTVQIFDETAQKLVLLATQGFDSAMTEHFYQVNASFCTPCGTALRTGNRTLVDFDAPESDDPEGAMRIHVEAGYLSAQSTPLVSRSGRAIGMVSTHWRQHYRPSDRELRFLDLLARQAADLIEQRQTETALRQSEGRYRTLFESIDEGFCVIEVLFDDDTVAIDYRFLEANPVFEQQTGLKQVIGKTVGELVPNLESHWFEIYGRVALTGEAIRFENQAESMGRWFDVYAFRIEQPESHKVAILFQDISDRKHAEAEREQLLQQTQVARTEAETANRLKDEFLAVLSHELRSPLNPILGWAKLLRHGKLDSTKTDQALAAIERNAKLQSELIEDLLDVSRILRGKLSLNTSPVSLQAAIQSAIETVNLAADAKSITVTVSLDPKVGKVVGDPTRLQQVVWNLLSNAVKFTPVGGRVEVKLEAVGSRVGGEGGDEGGNSPLSTTYAQITVTDNGKGIPANFLPHVFDYFRQEDGATTRKFGGLGLGLAIVRNLVELHGGTVEVTSEGEGLGSTFRVKLPLMPIQPPSTVAPSGTEPLLNLVGVPVLVIDDEADSRELIAFVLEQAGARVTTAATASEGFSKLTQSPPVILLSDVGMPDIDGYMLMQQIRALPPERGGQVKAIALTAYAGDFNQQQALQAGFQRHVSKPVEPEELVREVVSLLK